ncbi:hypothetical protein H8S90_16820 [Olivibacter sp. SDN3]|uniref:hypothetical protein n=1 Tax=Olivibacter sp. SDN3 TaxID=2764720 RepID=UPI0016512A9D|nr:hypothetical protein [Olivibacter sp. SDN3]QNL48445.1 hypothetical protein H8S90_16820 [Olivibacter sp. SDN3]
MLRLFLLFIFTTLFAQGMLLAQQQRFRLITKEGTNQKISKHTDTIHSSKVYIVSGSLGVGIPMGRTREVLDVRLASSWGMDISLPNRHYVLYPSLDMWSFGYNQQNLDNQSSYLIENGRARYFNLNLPIGTRRQFHRLNSYVTIGPSVGLFFEPRAVVQSTQVIRNDFTSKLLMGGRISAGADYKFKGFFIYFDTGWMHSFGSIQDRPLNILSFYVGLKTDITNVADRVITVFERKGTDVKADPQQ